ncbi:MAG: aminotransferase class IV [Flavobacterium sp. BFFFF2]|nr:MAG: aminotransferase class IV [Flavobacterium sp. BFFFF2]
MRSINGQLLSSSETDTWNNRAFLYGDGVFETIRVSKGKILFWEAHYFRLMSAMRIIRLHIPLQFTPEYIEQEILKTLENNQANARVRLTVFRGNGGYYSPTSQEVEWVIESVPLFDSHYQLDQTAYTVDVYKDQLVMAQPLSNVKTTGKVMQVMAAIFAQENHWDSCLLLNQHKNVCEAVQGNVFMVMDNQIITPPLTEGCLKGIIRGYLLEKLPKSTPFAVVERPISVYELQEADELWITNVIQGIRPVTQFRKKKYASTVAEQVFQLLNLEIE